MKSIKLVENKSSNSSKIGNMDKNMKISLDKKCNINICSPSSLHCNNYNNKEKDLPENVIIPESIKSDNIPFLISDKAINNGDKKMLNIIMTPCDISNRKLHGNDENIFYEDYNKSDYEIYDSESESFSNKNEFIVADLNNNLKQISPNTGDINSDMSENNISINSYNNDNNEKQQLCNKDGKKSEINSSYINDINPSDEDSKIMIVNKSNNNKSKLQFQEDLNTNNPKEEIEDKISINHSFEDRLVENNKDDDVMSNYSKESDLKTYTKAINREEIEITLKNLDNLTSLTTLTSNELNIVFKTIFDFYDDKNEIKDLDLTDFNVYDHLTQEDDFFVYLFYKVSYCYFKTQTKSKLSKNEVFINFTKIDKHLKNNHSKEEHILEQYKQNEINLITINYIKNMCILKVDEIKKALHSVNCSLNTEIKNGNMYNKEFLNCFELISSQVKKIKKGRLNSVNRYSNYENFWVFIKKEKSVNFS